MLTNIDLVILKVQLERERPTATVPYKSYVRDV